MAQHGGALAEAMAAPALNDADKRQDCAWQKDKDMSLTKYRLVMHVPRQMQPVAGTALPSACDSLPKGKATSLGLLELTLEW